MAKDRQDSGEMTVREAGRKGGTTTKRRHGREFYELIGEKGGTATRDRAPEGFYERIGQMGGAKVRALVAAGREAEARRKASHRV